MIGRLVCEITVITLTLSAFATEEGLAAAGQWPAEKAWAWYDQQPWLVGCNFLPSTAVNDVEMWQKDTLDAKTIDRELAWAQELGFNTVRVFLNFVVWREDAAGLKKRFAEFLNIASQHGISAMPILFDDCNFAGRVAATGKQPDPVPGVHNSQWVSSPPLAMVTNRSAWPPLEQYVRDMVGSFAQDRRVLVWDLYNEPGNGMGAQSQALMEAAFAWAREANPTQPLTTGAWTDFGSPFSQRIMKLSDLVSFHGYDPASEIEAKLKVCAAHGRPVLCTEWLVRRNGNTFERLLPLFRERKIGCWSWGLVTGRTQTRFPWGSPKDAPEPEVWQHDILRADGTPFDAREVQLIKVILGKLPASALPQRTALAQAADLTLWYRQPASNNKHIEEALPLGNGRMGCMMSGGVANERIQFNEQSLWSGDNNWDGEYECGDHGFGAYRSFGDLTITWKAAGAGIEQAGAPADYRRELDIATGIHRTTFTQGGVRLNREAFASHPDQVMVFHYTASRPGALSGRISLKSAQKAQTQANEHGLFFAGEMPNKLKHGCAVRALHTGGTVTASGEAIAFVNCDDLTLLLDARTNYKPDYSAGWRGADPLPLVEKELAAAHAKSFDALRSSHVADLSSLLGRVTLDIGATAPEVLAMPTDARLKRYAEGKADAGLETMMFCYGRYLLASSSRPGGLPANLQGLWNDSNNPPWASDYHNNINVQMNYWGAESTALSECHLPLIDFVLAAQKPCRIATRKAFGENTRGWTARTSQNIFGGNGWEWNIPASAWYAQHLFEHWAFTQDKDYLAKTAYPVIKEICQYWEDRLKRLPDGTLVAPNGWSPEHGPREDGVMHDQQLIWDLFENCRDAAKALGVDADYQAKIADLQARLAPNKIGKWGQLQEWQLDRDETDDTHRHTSHLFAVYPGRQISPTWTPELARAAVVSLKARSNDRGDRPFGVDTTIGDSRRSWTWPWRCAIWARLGEGERAGIMVRGLLTYNTSGNLFCNHPPFQMDGNFGITGAIAEMLLQSHAGEIALIPAIPKAWAASGLFMGLKARGNFTVDATWKDGKVIDFAIRSRPPRPVKVRVNGEVRTVNATKE